MAQKSPKPLVAGNWKMNGTTAALKEARLLAGMLEDVRLRCEVMICPPATLITSIKSVVKGAKIKLGGQDCHWYAHGAHTGDISSEMLKDAGCSAVIVGHSERRADHGETDETVRLKAEAAYRADLTAIICIGETLEERKAGRTLEVIARQLKGSLPMNAVPTNTVVAYEPVWAIGTGLTPTVEQVAEVHASIRAKTDPALRILYGGSVKPANAVELMSVANVNGALVGGASLKAADFIGIIKAYT
ncbi:triose-phosphate isomerase [Taklimakanibacter albus]|uniref:Triose-phosphate isomerase n=1 Tax=Taklimakanibacter albus TaxID=2800327 RepID=A0ACC5R1X4_9HYPH|nr:triose-phosphate isomerase [Aestuariivirga sp. YIM B02566]MBK1866481.1 triose-phosphate isomerase [Aestuariivirga sp. YIM B02566]